MASLRRKFIDGSWSIHPVIPFLLGMVVVWFFWASVTSTSWSRIAAIQPVESYAFAVHEQLMRNFDATGSFYQTIHSGYDDKWTWSGHRALTLPLMAKIYGLHPTALWLSFIQISFVSLGAFAAGALGKKAMRSSWGWLWGVTMYCATPAAAALALQDYQDLVFALPGFLFAIWAFQTGKWWLAAIGVIVGMAPREECLLMVIGLSVICIPFRGRRPKWGAWIRNIFIACSLIGYYAWWVEKSYPIATSGHDMPLQNAVRTLGSGRIHLEGWLYLNRFYLFLWVPMGVFAIFSPGLAFAGMALCVLHMTVPNGHGVDRSWAGHAHHMAPAAAMSISAITIGGGRFIRGLASLLKWIGQRRGLFHAVCYRLSNMGGLLVLALASWSIWWFLSWATQFNLIVTGKPTPPSWTHPIWSLVERLPEDAVPVVDKKTSIAVSNYEYSYTYDESLYNKSPRKGLQSATHLIFDQRREKVMEWISSKPGYQVIDEAYPYLTITWDRKQRDRSVNGKPKFSKVHAWTGDYSKGSDIPGVPPHEKTIKRQNGTIPILQIFPHRRPPPR